MSPTAAYLVETFITLVGVVIVAAVVLVGARRLGVGAPSGPLELVGRLPLDARRAVYLVRVGENVLVLGSSEAGLVKLSEVARADLPVPAPQGSRTFGDVLRRLATPPRVSTKESRGEDALPPRVRPVARASPRVRRATCGCRGRGDGRR